MEPQRNYEEQIMRKLELAIQWADNNHTQLLQQILTIERVLNNIKDTKPIIRVKQMDAVVAEKEQEQLESEKYQRKYEEMLITAEEQLKNIYQPNKPKKVQPLPVIEKKPPVPAVNRSKNSQTYFPKPNPPRNKNQVTPKITQTPVLNSKKSNTRTHINSAQKSIPTTTSTTTTNTTNTTNISKNTNQTTSKSLTAKRQSNSTGKIEQKQNKTKIIQFQGFQKSVQAILFLQEGKNTNKSNRKGEIDHLFKELEREGMGHKQNLEKFQAIFMKDFMRVAKIRQQIPLEVSTEGVQDRFWGGHPPTFKFNVMAQKLFKLLQENPISQQYRMQLKTSAQILSWHQHLNTLFTTQIQPTKSTLQLPPKLDITLPIKPTPQTNLTTTSTQKSNIHELQFYQLIREMLEELKQLDSFDKETLSKLRTLISIVMYDGRRSLTLVQAEKFGSWREYYLQEE